MFITNKSMLDLLDIEQQFSSQNKTENGSRNVSVFFVPLLERRQHLGIDARTDFGDGRTEIFKLKVKKIMSETPFTKLFYSQHQGLMVL